MLNIKKGKVNSPTSPLRGYVRKGSAQLRRYLFHLLCQLKLVRAWQFCFQKNKPSIVLYHDPSPECFAAQIKELQKYFNFISLRDYIAARSNNMLHRLPKYPLIITIDDGLVGNFRLLDTIVEKRVPVTIFLTSGVVSTNRHFWWTHVKSEDEFLRLKKASNEEVAAELGRSSYSKTVAYSTRQALNACEIEKMAPYIDFQAHTRFHPVLPTCTADEAYDEISGCKADLEKQFAFDIYALAYPHGDYCDRDIELAKQAGYLCALTVDAGLNSKSTDMFRLKRIYMPDDAGSKEAVVKASGLWTALKKPFKATASGI